MSTFFANSLLGTVKMNDRNRPRQVSSTDSTSSTSSTTISTSSTSATPSTSTSSQTPTPTSMESSTSSEPSSSSSSSPTSEPPPPSSSSSSNPPEPSSSSSSVPPPPSSSSEPPESSSVPPSSSDPPSSSSSASPSSSSSNPASSSSAQPNSSPSSTPTLTPPPSSSIPLTNTIPFTSSTDSLTTITTLVDGQLTTIVGPIPTSLSPSPNQKSSSKRNATIAGATTAAVLLILLILALTFVYRRHRRKLHDRLQTLLHPRRNAREGRGLLEGEDFFDDDEDGDRERALALRAYKDANRVPTSMSQNTLGVPSGGGGVASRATTPGGVEPLQVRDAEAGYGLGLGSIVDEVMGPSSPAGPPPHHHHTAEVSTSTTQSGYTGVPLVTVPSNPSIYNDPFRPASPSQQRPAGGHLHDESVYYALPTSQDETGSSLLPGAAPPKRVGYRSGAGTGTGTGPIGRAVEGLVRQFSSRAGR